MAENKEKVFLVKESILETKALLSVFSNFINKLSWSYYKLTGIEQAELFGEANVALLKAHKDFDKLRSTSFKSYAKYIIVDALNEYIRVNKVVVSIPKYISRANNIIRRIKKAINQDETLFYLIISGKTDIKELSSSIKKDINYLTTAAGRAKISIIDLVNRSEFLPSDTRSVIAVENATKVEDNYKDIMNRLFVKQIRELMSKDELKVADMIMFGISPNAISIKLGVSYPWVTGKLASIKKKVLKLMEKELKEK